MADLNTQLPSLPAAISATGTDLLLARQGTTDKKLTVDILKNYLLNGNEFTAAQILTLLLTVDGTGSLLDADKLDGQEGSFYRDATNLNAGIIPSTRLSASDLLTLIKTVDGVGSGLDADLLDAQDSSFYRNASNLNAGKVASARLPAATTTAIGAIEQATQTEVNSGAAGNLAVLASTLRNNVAYSLGDTGYIRFPSWLGGFTAQWGNKAVPGDSSASVNYPIAFTDVFQVLVSYESIGTSADACGISNKTTTSFNIINGNVGGTLISWLAVGIS